MRHWIAWTVLGISLSFPAGAAGPNFSGEWSYRALNSGDTNFKVVQDGAEITFYRVLHPEYEGRTYKLEHMYRGRVAANKIEGKLLVREEGMADFEILRPFKGEVKGADRVVMDDLTLMRQQPVVAVEPAAAPAAEPDSSQASALPPAASSEPKYSKVVVKRKQEEKFTGEAAPPAIPSLIPVAGQIQTETGRAADKALVEGDDQFARKRYDEALARYQEALRLNPKKVEVLYKLGLSYGTLGSKMVRAGKVEGAVDNLRRAVQFWEQAVHFDPYNGGAKENIRRAKDKLQKLEYK